MIFYHASKTKHEIGDTLTHTQSNTCKYYPDVNIALEKVKPQGMLGRDNAIYITNDSAFAKHFISSQHKQSKTFIYEVSTTDEPSGHPFAVIHQINKHINNLNGSKVNVLALEYWQPSQQWKFYEYLVSNITITGIIEVDDNDIILATLSYQDDISLATSI
jgi:hypothetical protein